MIKDDDDQNNIITNEFIKKMMIQIMTIKKNKLILMKKLNNIPSNTLII